MLFVVAPAIVVVVAAVAVIAVPVTWAGVALKDSGPYSDAHRRQRHLLCVEFCLRDANSMQHDPQDPSLSCLPLCNALVFAVLTVPLNANFSL